MFFPFEYRFSFYMYMTSRPGLFNAKRQVICRFRLENFFQQIVNISDRYVFVYTYRRKNLPMTRLDIDQSLDFLGKINKDVFVFSIDWSLKSKRKKTHQQVYLFRLRSIVC